MFRNVASHGLGAVGAVLGSLVGYAVFFWVLRQGFYALVIPGAMLGAVCGMLARHESVGRGIACGVAGLALGLYSEWKWAPFRADEGFRYFLTHPHHLKPITIIMILLGAGMAFWMGKGAALEVEDSSVIEARRRREKFERMRNIP